MSNNPSLPTAVFPLQGNGTVPPPLGSPGIPPPLPAGVTYPQGYTSAPPFVTQGSLPQAPIPPPTSTNVYQQIEGAASYYEPAIYELLTYYSALVPQPDELDGQFYPLTDVQPSNPTQTLIFAVGILPPSSNVTGRLLDRSATIAETMPVTQLPNQPPGANPGAVSGPSGAGVKSISAGLPGYIIAHEGFVSTPYFPTQDEKDKGIASIGVGHYGWTGGPITYDQAQTLLAGDLKSFQNEVNNYVTVPLTQNQYDALVDYCFSTGNIRNAPFLKDLNAGNYSAVAQQLPTAVITGVGGHIEPGLVAVRQNESNLFSTPDGSTYNYQGFNAPGINQPLLKAAQQGASGSDISKIVAQSGQQPGPGINGQSAVINGDGTQPSNGWQGAGSKNASQAGQNLQNYSNNNLNTTNLGQSFLQAQAIMAQATLAAIQQMKNTPPLKMLVNPTSFKLTAEKIVSDGDWGRNGPIVEHWGEQLDKLECSGKVAAFYALDQQGGNLNVSQGQNVFGSNFAAPQPTSFTGLSAGGGPGITRIARQYSRAYQNFLSLWLLYKNNGGLWLNPAQLVPTQPGQTASPLASQPTNLSVLGSIYIYYDNILYLGSFDNFNLTESETAPYTLEYNFTFTVRATFLLDNTDDLSLQISGLQQSQLNPLAGLPAPLQTSITPGAGALSGMNAQVAGSVGPPPGLTPQQYASIGASQPAVSTNTFTNRPR